MLLIDVEKKEYLTPAKILNNFQNKSMTYWQSETENYQKLYV